MPEESSDPPTLIVLGRASSGPKQELRSEDGLNHLEIEQVLYGHWPAKTLDFSAQWKLDHRGIFFLRPASYAGGPDLQLCYTMEPNELEAAKALCSARFDQLVLSAGSIFVGEEIGRASFNRRDIKVLRRIKGREFAKYEKLRVAIHTGIASDRQPRSQPGPRLYFIGDQKSSPANGSVYAGLSSLPVQLESKVREALARRDTYPIMKGPLVAPHYRAPDAPHFREVLFRGKTTDAIEFLDCEETAARVLGQRFLLANAQEGREALMKDISALMFRTDVAAGSDFVGQKVRIETLGMLERANPTGALGKLATELMEYIRDEPQPVPVPVRDEKRVTQWGWGGRERLPEEKTTDVNHSLTWLIKEMDDTEIARTVEQPLLAMRNRLAGWWRQEVELAIETSDVEQSRNLRDALQRSAGLRPVRSASSLRNAHGWGGSGLAISPDGAFLATDSNVWSLSDWSQVGLIPHLFSPCAFSPDGKFLYGQDYEQRNKSRISRYDWRTGHLEMSYPGNTAQTTGAQLSQDDSVLMTTSYYDDTLVLWETASGKKIRTERLPHLSTAAALSADGKRIARQTSLPDSSSSAASESLVESTVGKSHTLRLRFDFKVSEHAFTPDGRYLLSIGQSALSSGLRIDAYDFTNGHSQAVTSQSEVHFPDKLAVSPRGTFVAIADDDGRLLIYRMPGLVPTAATKFLNSGSISSLAFTNDEKMLIAAGSRSTPLILQTETLEEVVPYPGHPDEIQAMSYSSDGKMLRSIGRDGSICHWDPATMKMRARFPSPTGLQLISVREPDGKYALFLDSERSLFGSKSSRAVLVDMETGAEVANWENKDNMLGGIYWLPGDEILSISRTIENGYITRYQAPTGRIVSRVPYIDRDGLKFLSKNQRAMLTLPNERRSSTKESELLDLDTGAITKPSVSGEGNSRTINGEVYELLETTLKPNREPPIRRYNSFSVLSPDGRRLAVVTAGRKEPSDRAREEAGSAPTFIRIHDAMTLEMLCAFPASTSQVKVRFNSDGTKLAVANDDGTIESWELPR